MAKETTPAALATPELPGLSLRGRPRTGKAMSNAERQARYRAKHRARPQLEGTQADALAARIRAVQDEMVAQVMEIGELKPHLQTQIEGWFREMQQIRLALLGR